MNIYFGQIVWSGVAGLKAISIAFGIMGFMLLLILFISAWNCKLGD